MKTLFLLRHAKSSWDDPALKDFDRPLNERGREAAPRMGRELARSEVRPNLVLCSPAKRTRETINLVLSAAVWNVPVEYDERIYAASLGRLLEVVAGVDDKHDAVMIVGHNPGVEELLAHLTSESRTMPTAALARLTLRIENWSDISNDCGTLNLFRTPRELND